MVPGDQPVGFAWLSFAMRRGFFRRVPRARWRYRWSGQIALTDDHLPHLHEPAPGLLAGLGYNGRGVAMSLVMGRVLAERARWGRIPSGATVSRFRRSAASPGATHSF